MLRGAIGLRQLVGTWFQVLFHSPSRGSFHLSLALLYAIGRPVVLSLTGWSPQIHTGFHVSGATWDPHGSPGIFRLRDCHPLRWAFPCPSPRHRIGNSLGLSRSPCESHYTDAATAWTLARRRFGLVSVRSPLLRESNFFPFLQVLRCFSSLRSRPLARAPGDESRSVSRSRTSPDHSQLGGSPELFAA